MTGAEGAIPGQNRWRSREFWVLVVLVDDVPGSDHARERRKQEQNRQRAAGHERKSGGTIGECPDLHFGTLPLIDTVESPADERDDESTKTGAHQEMAWKKPRGGGTFGRAATEEITHFVRDAVDHHRI